MATRIFQKIYTKISNITKATCMLHATGVGNEELATINGRLAQVVRIMDTEVTLQVFGGTEGIPTDAEVVFLGKAPSLSPLIVLSIASLDLTTPVITKSNLI